jgi:hypothetical protein
MTSQAFRRQHPQQAHAPRVCAGTREFLAWCESASVASIADVKPLHGAAYMEQLGREYSAPTVKQRLAAIRHLFDWLVTGQVILVTPAHSVRGQSHSMKRGKTPALDGIVMSGWRPLIKGYFSALRWSRVRSCLRPSFAENRIRWP